MTDFTTITQVKITDSDTEVNKHLAGEWVLLDVCNREGRPVFVLGLPYQFDIDAYCAGAVSIPEV